MLKSVLLVIIITFLFNKFNFSQSLSEKIDTYISSYVSTSDFSGCALVTRNDSIQFSECYGKADFSFNVANTQETKFKIGSVSKQFTAAAILVLEQEGLLNTKDTISKYFPDYPIANNITIEQMLTHTSGLTDIYNVPNFNKLSCEQISISDLSKMILESDLDFKPGSQYQYSNGGFAVLAQIIEQVSGKPYGKYFYTP